MGVSPLDQLLLLRYIPMCSFYSLLGVSEFRSLINLYYRVYMLSTPFWEFHIRYRSIVKEKLAEAYSFYSLLGVSATAITASATCANDFLLPFGSFTRAPYH